MFRIIYPIYQWLIFVPIMGVVTLLAALITIVSCAFLDDRFWGFYPAKIWARLMCYLSFVRVEIEGLENLEKNQSYVFMANHQSNYDIFAIYGWLNVPFKWIMKKELEAIPFVGRACKSSGHILMPRGQTKEALNCIQETKKKLINGLSIVMFPEGSRTYTGEMGVLKNGGFRVARDLQLPIVPITIIGAFEVLRRDTFSIKPGKIKLIFHPKIDTCQYGENLTELISDTNRTIQKGFQSEK